MKFIRIEHYDVFEGDVIIFWADIAGLPQEIQAAAEKIDAGSFNPNGFGLCVNYSFAEHQFYLVVDMGYVGASEVEERNIFYIDADGNKNWFKTDIPQALLDRIFKECGKIVASRGEKPEARPAERKE